MAEVFIIGQLIGGTKFPYNSLFCKWSIKTDSSSWEVEAGAIEGQTQVDIPVYEEFAHWAHPIDVHFRTKGLQGWPKIVMEIWHQDNYGLVEPCGYAFCHVPTSPGTHKIVCPAWRPVGTMREQLTQFFIRGGSSLTDIDCVYGAGESAGRHSLKTAASGEVHLTLSVVTRNFSKFGIEC